MPLSFGIPVGLLLAVVAAVWFFLTEKKKAAVLLFGFGLTITLGTIVLIVLAVNSMP